MIQDGATYHTSQATRDFIQQHQNRLIVYQLPTNSPNYNPIEHLWKKVKRMVTFNFFFDEFAKLVQFGENALVSLDAQADQIRCLMGVYTQ